MSKLLYGFMKPLPKLNIDHVDSKKTIPELDGL